MNEFVARCLLFTPANRPERFGKARELGADGIVIDLEDAIALPEKDRARETVLQYLKTRPQETGFIQAVRINSIRTRAGLKDLSALCDGGVRPDVLMLPKSESAAEFEIIHEILTPETVPILALIESARGMARAEAIARAPHVVGLAFGGADYAADLGARMEWEPLYAARAHLMRAAASAGIAAIDVPYLHLADVDDTGLLEETRRVKAMGYTCKLSIHPKHIRAILETLSPSTDEIAQARRIVAAYEAAAGNACELDGKMIDVPVYRSAKRILSLSSHS